MACFLYRIGRRKRFFLKKEAKTFVSWRVRQTGKSFLVLFSKKELLSLWC